VQLAAQRQQVESLKVYADTARLRYDNGYTSYLEVVDAERSLFNAQLTYTQTQQTSCFRRRSICTRRWVGAGWCRPRLLSPRR
jgi:multidrug efflux system outer membrane protein